jgi:hypothetical protein
MLFINKKQTQKLKTRFLSKISLLDILFVCAFLALLAFFILVFSRSDKTIAVTVKVTDQNVYFLTTQPSNEYVYSFKQDDVERNEVGKVIAEVKNVRRFQTDPKTYAVYLDLNLKANYNPLKKQYSFKGRPIIFGQDLAFDFANTKVQGIVVDFPGYSPSEKKPVKLLATVQLRNESRSFSDTYGMPSFYKQAVKTGDIIKDNHGQEVIKVLDVKSSPAKRTVITPNNQSVTINDQELVDVFYTVEINAYEVEDRIYILDFIPVQVGNTIPMVLENVSLWPTLISFQKI